jgi:ligand-binding sensor domain-containing protein
MVSFGTREGLPSPAIDAFLETRSGAYLVGTNGGLSLFNSNTGGHGFITYRQGTSFFDKPIQALLESKTGTIWCGTLGRLLEALRSGTLRPVKWSPPENVLITDIKEDAGGKLWVATMGGGIYVLGRDNTVQHITQEDGLPNPWVANFLLDHAGRLWAGTRSGLVLMRNDHAAGRCGVQRVYREKGGLPSENVLALAEAPDGSISIGTGVGIAVLPHSGDPPFRNLTRSDGLTDRAITALTRDRAGNMWAGTRGVGVMRIASAGFVTFHERDGLATDWVYSVFGDRGGAVLAVNSRYTGWGRLVNVFDPVNLKFHTVVPKVFGEKASWGSHQILLQARTGEWWAASIIGLRRFEPMSVAQLAKRQPQVYAQDLSMYAVFDDSKGGIWASAQGHPGDRLLRWDPVRKAISWFEDGPRRNELVMALAKDPQGNIWMGPSRGDLFRYDGRQFARFKRGDGVPAGVIDALLVDHSGRLWIGSTGGGLGMLENLGSAAFRVRTYDMASGLPATISCASRKTTWAGSMPELEKASIVWTQPPDASNISHPPTEWRMARSSRHSVTAGGICGSPQAMAYRG